MSAILAIDLGKRNSVFCWYDTATHGARFQTLATHPDALREAI
jgi:hypothetical protein